MHLSSTIDSDVSSLSSQKLGYILKLSTLENVAVEQGFLNEVRHELIARGHLEQEAERQHPH